MKYFFRYFNISCHFPYLFISYNFVYFINLTCFVIKLSFIILVTNSEFFSPNMELLFENHFAHRPSIIAIMKVPTARPIEFHNIFIKIETPSFAATYFGSIMKNKNLIHLSSTSPTLFISTL